MDSSIERSTADNYHRGIETFVSWLRDRSESPGKATVFTSIDELDITLSHFIQHVFDTTRKVSHAHNATYGLEELHPELKGKLVRARKCMRGWRKKQPSVPWPPMPYNIALYLAMRFARDGRMDLCLAILLTFNCMLRISELRRLKKEDVALAADPRLGAALKQPVLRLGRTKTGDELSATVDDPFTATLLRWWVSRCKRGQLLFNFGTKGERFREAIHEMCVRCGLSERYVPHSLRHGGASHRYLLGEKLDDIMLKGRWKAAMSARHYIQQARALALREKIPLVVARAAAAMEQRPWMALRMALAQ